MQVVKHWLIVDYSGAARIVSREPSALKGTEVALEVTVSIPQRILRQKGAINVTLPDLQPQVQNVEVLLAENVATPAEVREGA